MINPGRPFWLLPLGLGSLLTAVYLSWLVLASPLPLVGVIQWTEEIKLYEDTRQGVIEGLREEGYQDGLNMRLKVINAQADRAQAADTAREFQEQGARLVITLGVIPTLIALEVTRPGQMPVVYSAAATPEANGLSLATEPQPFRFTGTSLEVPAAEQLRLLFLARPRLQRLGILNCGVTPQGVASAKRAAAAAQDLGLTVIREEISDDRPELLERTLTDLMHQKIGALFIPADPVLTVPKNLIVIIQRSNAAGIPVMASSQDSVKAGALMAYHADFVETGRQTGRQAGRLLAGAPPCTVPPEPPIVKRLTLNLRVAQDLNLPLPRKLLSRVDNLCQ
jgi:putative ABC transport system substrate-binding protein